MGEICIRLPYPELRRHLLVEKWPASKSGSQHQKVATILILLWSVKHGTRVTMLGQAFDFNSKITIFQLHPSLDRQLSLHFCDKLKICWIYRHLLLCATVDIIARLTYSHWTEATGQQALYKAAIYWRATHRHRVTTVKRQRPGKSGKEVKRKYNKIGKQQLNKIGKRQLSENMDTLLVAACKNGNTAVVRHISILPINHHDIICYQDLFHFENTVSHSETEVSVSEVFACYF